MKRNPFYLKGIHKRKVKVTCSPERQIVEDRLIAEDKFIEAQNNADRKERIAKLIKEDLDARNNRS